ncbi:MAG: FAD-dependent oxidoreductase [Ignavibacteriales bacterium]|nr:FAD-dependent oxidoreductase [Ignavibacteriales bacterium]MCB9218004.1 FAD-dependent oxidoreductase [Ignavibacteriales bacterium]
MQKEVEVSIPPDFIKNYDFIKNLAAKKIKINPIEINSIKILKRSIDARKQPIYRLRIIAYINESPKESKKIFDYKSVNSKKKLIIIGSGPAGLFAALRAIELGIKPIIFERGKNVRDRRFDLKYLMQEGIVNQDSNYCFGEGGAGTYSDGKLYTRSNKRGNVNRILDILIHHGANEDIRIDSHPHIGSNKLPKIIQNIRNTILSCNGEIHFNSKVTDFLIEQNKMNGVIVNNNSEFLADGIILATGHSARDIYYLFRNRNIKIESKPFSMGVRIEHPQALIDSIQYHSKERHTNLPASSYNLTCQVDNKGVYSFCMCPGGIIIPASTQNNELVLNGMSVSKRNSPFANSGLVVEVNENDWNHLNSHGVFAGLEFQKEIESKAFSLGGENQIAPAQRITDFAKNRLSNNLPKSSYIPGTKAVIMEEVFPKQIVKSLKKSLFVFNKKMKGYFTKEAQILAVESRTSSPLRIPRDKETFMHPQIIGLFPSGEGAGYAGGIVSAAIDGEKCCENATKFINQN